MIDISDLADAILAEEEIPEPPKPAQEAEGLAPGLDKKIDTARQTIRQAARKAWRLVVAFSGGGDSSVALQLTAGVRPDAEVVWVDSQMEYPETEAFVRGFVDSLGMRLRVARAARTPTEQWRRHGWPMLGKRPARIWMQGHAGFGFRVDCSSCCRNMKIVPGRQMTKNAGASCQITGQRGDSDDALRGTRARKDGRIFFNKQDKIWIANPLDGWTDADIREYKRRAKIPEHPARARGADTIGCVYCGGGSQFFGSKYRVLRRTWPEAWRRFMVDWGGGLIILAIKHDQPINRIVPAVEKAGGLTALAETRPWIFDYTRKTPRKGYQK